MSDSDDNSPPTTSMRSPRFGHWVFMFVFSIITLGSSVETAGDFSDRSPAQNWAICVSALSFLFTAAAVIFHVWSIMSTLFIGTKFEGVIIGFLVIGWAAGVATVSDSDNELAVDSEGRVSNGNLYYFSWASFVCSVTLAANFLQHVFNIDVGAEIRNKAKRMTLWSSLLAISLIVMASSANIYESVCDGAEPVETSKYCKRTAVGISFGCIGTLVSLAIVVAKITDRATPFLYEALCAYVLVLFNAICVAFVTSNDGPGAPLGNLYYSTWGSFLVSLLLAKSCFEDYQVAKHIMEEQQNGDQNGGFVSQEQPNLGGDENI
uniref:Uncharacterized protein n=1 Tax=Leptocylindrus danicus TaxID=163516 RepID=A0A7S2L4P5_9STRA|mmetsp:Transcript_3085/g.4487  ORF Transcript_3085/g.4487 Transcript_3085/m.4487 type:complete len:321 (+) Transcript_3085:55-1017(+)|eukprot:CAMPEP_0116036442 /NCGR_PEP_ID=MMETSP0321-20121206/21211_1 /TAXON_ID=163516 /ORGANISM="Leptocylindrus danicus var. danicus, Strain B650" /LENGTH=320 /DNA_ID=CAMNT_0003513957 /DNA_START=55 /DNA_END=1017 /DNA_ORIENTATION=+